MSFMATRYSFVERYLHMSHLQPFRPLMFGSAVLLLTACATEPVSGPVPFHDATPRAVTPRGQTPASFECSGALPAVHRQICASEGLAQLDRQVAEAYRERMRQSDLPGQLLLEANQRQWQLSRTAECGLETAALGEAANPQAIGCLESVYRARLRQLQSWQPAQARAQGSAHPMASYAEFRTQDDRDPALCSRLQGAFNESLRRNGRASPELLTGATLIAGSSASVQSATVGGQRVSVTLHNAGTFGGHAIRALGMSLNDQPVMDDRTLPQWIAQMPNYGGRAHASSSQTGDYDAIDVFTLDGRSLVMVSETWGFYSPAARGESAYAGLYELGAGALRPLCLYQTYLTPPRTNTLAGLTVYASLASELEAIAGTPLNEYAQHERRDNFQSWKEQQWTLLNLPLLGADELARFGREGALRQRHDAALEALFQWSERNLGNKTIYRRVLPMMQPAHTELRQMFVGQGLDASEASAAADLLFHETLARATENLAAPKQAPALPLAPFAEYRPRFAVAPTPGELERGRQFATLHSVLLNNAPANVIRDFIDYETSNVGLSRGRGPDNDSAAMAAVGNPDALRLILGQGFSPDQTNDWGKTALMTAAQLNLGQSVSLLLEQGADPHRQTRGSQSAGVGGPDRAQAAALPRTALLIAAEQADAEVIQRLLDAGADRQAWAGYHQQVCSVLGDNRRLEQGDLSTLRGRLCQTAFAEVPIEREAPGNLRLGETLVIREDGASYPVTLVRRDPMTLFGRQLDTTPKAFRSDLAKVAQTTAVNAVRRGGVRLAGPLTLVFADLSSNSEERLSMEVAFPVGTGISPVAGYNVTRRGEEQVLRVPFDTERNDVEGTWRALMSAALTQSFRPTGAGYVVIHTRGTSSTEYQLVVTDR
jgi:uncharacterized protein YecT (DUF1311 family)